MSGRGKGGKALWKGGAKGRGKVLRDKIRGMFKPVTRRLARRGGVKRISETVYKETRDELGAFIDNIIRDAFVRHEIERLKDLERHLKAGIEEIADNDSDSDFD